MNLKSFTGLPNFCFIFSTSLYIYPSFHHQWIRLIFCNKIYYPKKHWIKVLSIWLYLACAQILSAQNQPPICPNPSFMTPTCLEACLICDIHGFTGRNTSTLPGELPSDFCTTVKHNGQWIAFMASSASLKLRLSVYNCVRGDGLEVGLYESVDCRSFKRISNCDGDVNENSSTLLTTITNLIVGNYYYLVIDGNRGDICDYRVSIEAGSTKIPTLTTSGTISGPINVCQGAEENYSVSSVPGAVWQKWFLDGVELTQSSTQKIKWTDPGVFELCVKARNACDTAPPSCIQIRVTPAKESFVSRSICLGDSVTIASQNFYLPGIYDIFFQDIQGCDTLVHLDLQVFPPALTRIKQEICPGMEWEYLGQKYTQEGSYSIHLQTTHGCDSLILLELKFAPEYQKNLDLIVCEGDSIELNGQFFSKGGNYTQKLQTSLGCDSILNLYIKSVQCNLKSLDFVKSVRCFGEANGELIFLMTQGTGPFRYAYHSLSDPMISDTGIILNLGDTVFIRNLPAGDYQIVVVDNYSNSTVFFQKITEPAALQTFISSSNFAGFQVPCFGDSVAWIELTPQGGSPAYTYLWSDQKNNNRIENLKAGIYHFTLTDDHGCSLIRMVEIRQPAPIEFDFTTIDPSCEDNASGQIQWSKLRGGIPPFDVRLNGISYPNFNKIQNLSAGKYQLVFVDSLGCTISKEIQIREIEHTELNGKQEYVVDLGDSIELNVYSRNTPSRIQWLPDRYLRCNDCLLNISKPLYDLNYWVYAWSADGCPDSLEISIVVKKNKHVFAPNAFTPNGDGVNDFFKLFGSKDLSEIKYLYIFDRWGAQVFSGTHLNPESEFGFWDGSYRNAKALPGVYTWMAEVLFLDGEREVFSGDLNLIR